MGAMSTVGHSALGGTKAEDDAILPPPPCAQCGRPRMEHAKIEAVSPLDPPVYICPRSVYQPEK
jgi:hypothetical protein